MQSLKNSFQQSAKYFGISIIGLLLAGEFLLLHGKPQSFLLLTPFHQNLLDIFFAIFTYMGDGIFVLSLVVIFFLCKLKQLALSVLVSYSLSGMAAQTIKTIWPQPRPVLYFGALGQHIHEINNATASASYNSFPSGHAASAFALLTTLFLFFPNNKWNIFFIFLAFAECYSRMYTSNHFLGDVIAGAFVGIIFGIISYEICRRIFSKNI